MSENDGLMAVAAFRYCLGRTTYMSHVGAEWIQGKWPELTGKSRIVIERELSSEIAHDDEARASGDSYKPLGHDCDRAAWVKLHEFIKTQEGKP